MGAVPVTIGIRPQDDGAMDRPAELAPGVIPITLDVDPLPDDAIETIEDLDTVVETVMCSCSAGDDNPY